MAEETLNNTTLLNPADIVSIDPPVKKTDPPTYEQAMSSLINKTNAATPFAGTNVLTGTQVDYEPTKKYLNEAYGYSPNRDNEDFYAQQQGFGGDLADAVVGIGLKFPALAATKVIGGLGYVTALLNPTNWTSEDGFIASASDNAMSKWAESAEESVKNEWMPTFQEAADVNKGFFSRAFTDLDFWTTDVVDGAAFMASAFVPGMALSKLGVGAKLAQGLSKLRLGVNAAGEVVNGLEVAQRYLGSAQRIANGFDAATTWALATSSEAMYEAADVRDNVIKSLDGKIDPKTGLEYTEEDKKSIAGGAARNTFLMNAALLGATNAIQMKYLYKALGVAESTVGRVVAKAGEEGFERVVAKTKWGKFLDTRYGEFAKGVAVGTLSEGYVEENVQLAIQRLNQEFGSAGRIAGVKDYYGVIEKAAKQIKDATLGDDQEASLSIGLGALLGGVMGGIGNAKQFSRDRITTDDAINRLNQTQNSWLKFGNLYQTTQEDVLGEDGQPTGQTISKVVLDEDGQPVIDESKLADIITDFNSNATMAELADKFKDKNQAKFLRDLSFRNFVHAHIEAGIEDALLEKLDNAASASPEALAKMGFDPTLNQYSGRSQEVAEYKALADQIIKQNNLIKNSILRTGKPQEEQARINTMVALADEQSIVQGIVRNLSREQEAIKSQIITTENTDLSDMTVDAVNSIQYRIDSQKAYIEALQTQGNQSVKLKVAKQLLAELNKQKAKFKTDNSLSFENLAENPNGYYDYSNPARSSSPLNIAFQRLILEKAQYENISRSRGLEFALYADTVKGLDNFKNGLTQDVVNTVNESIEQDIEEEELGIKPAQLDPNDPRLKFIYDERDNAIQDLGELYEEPSGYVVALSKDGVKILQISNGVTTNLEDIVPDQFPQEFIDQLKEVDSRIKVINDKAEADILNISTTDNPPTPADIPEVAPVGQTTPTTDVNLVETPEVKVDPANKFKIKRENELIRIYPYQQTDSSGKKESIPAAQRRLDDLLKQTSPEDLANGITMTVSKGGRRTTSIAGETTGNPNGNLEVNSDFLTVQLEYNGQPIGFITNYTHYSVRNKAGKNVPIENLTIAQFNEIFDTTGKDAKLALDTFKQNFLKGRRLFSVLSKLLGNSVSVPVSNSEINKMLNLNVSTGEFDFVSEDQAATLGELDYNTINGEIYVIDRTRKYEKGKFVTRSVPITDAVGKERRQIEKEIKDTKALGRDLTQQLGRYVAVVKMPNGVIRFVELTSDKWTDDRLSDLVGQINERSRLSKENNLAEKTNVSTPILSLETGKYRYPKYTGGKDETYNDALNTEIADNLFIALDEKHKGTYIDFFVNAMGNLQLKINIPEGTKTIKHSIVVRQEDNTKPLNFESTDDMIAKINKAIVDYNKTAKSVEKTVQLTLTKDNFKQSIPTTITASATLNLRTSVLPNILKNVSLTYTPKDTIDAVIPAKPAREKNDDITLNNKPGKKVEIDPKAVQEFREAAGMSINQDMLNQLKSEAGLSTSVEVKVNGETIEVEPEQIVEYPTEAGTVKYINNGSGDLTLIDQPTAEEQLLADQAMLAGLTGEELTSANIKFTFKWLLSGLSETAALKVAQYAERIIKGESREKVLEGLGKTFINNVDKVIGQLTNMSNPSIEAEPRPEINPLQTTPVPVKSFREQSDDIKLEKFTFIQTRSKELIEQGLTRGRATIQARKEADIIYDKRLEDLKLKVEAKNNRALKVLDRDTFDISSVEHIDTFKKFVKDNLPETISVIEANDLAYNMASNKVTVGMFVSYMDQLKDGNTTIKGRITVGENTPYKYHEAFHAVFRLLSTDTQISQLLSIAGREVKANLKKQKTTLKQALEDFRSLHEMYSDFTPSQLEQRYYEEYLADRFDDWKTDKKVDTSFVAKGLFARIMDWITRLFTGRTAAELESLFTSINNGKYRNSNIKDNRFTREESNMVTETALKVITVGTEIVKDENGNDIVIDRFLSQQEGDQLAASVTSVFYDRISQEQQYNKLEILNEILDDYKELYNPEREDDYYFSEVDRLFPDEDQSSDMENYLERLQDKYKVFSVDENRQALIEAVDVHLKLMGFKEQEDTDVFDDAVDENGDRVTTDNWKETHSIGGFGSLSQFLRQYIATTTYEYVDEFGNSQLKDGVPLLQAVNANLVYNGMLKSVANISDQNTLMSRLRLLKASDTETGKFITKFFDDAGIEFNEDGTWYSTNPNRARLIQQVIKGFNQYSVDYIFLNKDIRKEAQITHTMVANRRDSGKTQFSIWQNAYVRIFEDEAIKIKDAAKKREFYDDRIEPLKDLYTLMAADKEITDSKLEQQSKEITNALKNNIGISLDNTFVKYSILSNKDKDKLSEAQTVLLNAYDEAYAITREDVLQIMRSIQNGENPFAKNIDDEINEAEEFEDDDIPTGGDLGKGGVITRINNLAKGNAVFDETVYSSSWKNAKGELVYTHQLPTYNLVAIQDLNSDSYIEELRNDPFLQNNYLLNSSEFEQLQGELKVSRIDGTKSSILSKTEDGVREDKTNTSNKNKGLTYGEFSDREFLSTLIDLYAHGKELRNENGPFRTSQHLIRVLEASNTGDTVSLPVIKAVDKTASDKTIINDATVDILYNEVQNEFERIRRVQEEINYITSETGTITDQIDGYHYGTNKSTGKRDYSKGRGLQFYKTGLMLGTLKTELESLALDPTYNLSSSTADIKRAIRSYWMDQSSEMMELLSSTGVIIKDTVDINAGEKQTYTNALLDKYIEKGFFKNESGKEVSDERKNSLLNIVPGDIQYNITQILLNDYINTLSLNQLILGDQAMSLKDSVDEVKRAKGANGSGPSIESYIISPEVGITEKFTETSILQFEDPLYRSQYSGGNKEKADAQMWGTVKSMRYTLHGLGKLDPFTAKMLDKIEKGQSLTSQEIFGYYDSATGSKVSGLKDLHSMFNSLKLVYYDGKMYIKTSFVMLTKELTSYNDNGVWKALPGKEELHNMREKLEDYESRNNTVTYAVPKSASKGLKVNIAASANEAQDHNFQPQQTKYWRLQLENPSNKLIITDPTQAKQLILAEQDDSTVVDFMGTNITVGEVKKLYLQDTAQRVKNNYVTARNEIFNIEGAYEELSNSIDLGKVTPKLAKFQKRAVESLKASGADSQMIDFFELDKSGKPRYNLNNPITLDKYTQLFLAYFSKGVLSEKVPGHSVALMSNYGYKMVKQVVELDPETNQPTRWNIVRADKVKNNPTEYANATLWNNELDREFTGLQVGSYYIDDLRHNVPEYNDKGEIIGRFSEFVMPPHFAELMNLQIGDNIPESIMKSFGVRIPSQDKHSTISLKMVDLMPAFYGSTGIYPHELIEISGADFDIDKLYMHIADTYSKDGKLIAYGTAVTPQDKFNEYIEYLRKNNKDFKSAVKDLRRDTSNTTLDDLISPDEALGIFSDALSMESIDDNMFLYKEALKMLGLPSEPQDYVDYVAKNGELNNGVLNNRILAQKLNLVNNEYMVAEQANGTSPIAFEVASVDPLKDIVDELVREFGDPNSPTYVKEIADIVSENPTDTDSLLGKYKAFKNNKEGSRNIGPAVNSILAYSIMSTFNINLRRSYIDPQTGLVEDLFLFKLNGHTFDTYAPKDKSGKLSLKAYNPVTKEYDGDRIFGSISTVVSAMTDNAKERLAARLGLNIDAITYVTNMLAQGVPIKSAIKFLLQPSIREYFDQLKRTKYVIKTAAEQQIKRREILNDLIAKWKDRAGEDAEILELTDTMLDNGLVTNGDNPEVQYTVLVNLNGLINQSVAFGNVAKVLKLTKGLGTSYENMGAIQDNIDKLGLRLRKNSEFEETMIPFDLRQTFMGYDKSKPYHEFMNNYIRTADQIEHMSQAMFIEKTPVFKRISELVVQNLSVKPYVRKEFETTLKRDLISYLSIKAYMKDLKDNGRSRTLQSLDNAMIYDEAAKTKPESFNDIIDTFKIVRRALPDNYFASKFVDIISTQRYNNDGEVAMNDRNRDGINKAEANTWAKLSEYQVEKIKDSFLEIYQNDSTRENAVDIFNYLLVKDAGQFKSNSFIRMIPTFMFNDLLLATGRVNDLLKLPNDGNSESSYNNIFGVDSTGLFNEFIQSYTGHFGNRYHVTKLNPGAPKYAPSEYSEVNKHNPNGSAFKVTGEKVEEVVSAIDNMKSELGVKTKEKPKSTAPQTPGITIDVWNGVRTNESFDTGDNRGIIQLKSKGKLNNIEKGKYAKNMLYLQTKGFPKYGQYDLAFPYVIVNTDKSGSRKYYRLVQLGKGTTKGTKVTGTTADMQQQIEQLTNSKNANNFIVKGELMARGQYARYEEYTPVGSDKSTLIGELFGPVPAIPRKPRVRKQYGNSTENTGRYSDMSAEDIMNRMGLGEAIGEAVDNGYLTADMFEDYSIRTGQLDITDNNTPVDLLRNKYNIQAIVTKSGTTFKGAIWDLFSDDVKSMIKTPAQLLALLNEDGSDTSEPFTFQVEPAPDSYRDIPLPTQELSSTVGTQNQDEIEEEDEEEGTSINTDVFKQKNPNADMDMLNKLFNLNSKNNPLNDDCA